MKLSDWRIDYYFYSWHQPWESRDFVRKLFHFSLQEPMHCPALCWTMLIFLISCHGKINGGVYQNKILWRLRFHILSPLTLSLQTKWSNLQVHRLKQKRGPFPLPGIFRINENYSCSLHQDLWNAAIPSFHLAICKNISF